MKRAGLSFIFSFIFSISAFAQLSTPDLEAVYGGRILGITGYALSEDSTRVFISTESANTLFYSDIYTNSSSIVFDSFQTIQAVDADDDYGDAVQSIAVHEGSGYLFFAHNTDGLLKVSVSSSTPSSVTSGYVTDMLIEGDTLIYLNTQQIHTATIDVNGTVTSLAGNIDPSISPGQQKVDLHPINRNVYVFVEGNSPVLKKSDDRLADLTNGSSFSDISPTLASSGVRWKTMAIAPSGRIFLFGDDNMNKYVAYSDDESGWTEASIAGGVTGGNVDFHGDSSAYSVYFAKLYNHNNGEGSWSEFGNVSQETHPNDGAVFADPINSNVIYMTTDQGIGISENGGSEIYEIEEGVEAVQIQDFDMTASKQTGWMASKSGLRRVGTFLSAPGWTNAEYPNGDGSPYFSIEIDPTDTSMIYAGNVRVYQSTNDGGNWNRVFTPEDAPYNFPNVGTMVRAIEVNPYDSSLVFAAVEVQDSLKGGLFYSADRGATWDQILLEASTNGEDVDVSDIVFTIEGADTVIYVSALYDLDDPQGRSVYRLTKNGATTTAEQNMDADETSTGSLIVASIWDLELSQSSDTVFAVGTDAGINHPIAYYKALNGDNLWTPLTTSGFPFEEGKLASAASIGVDTLFVAVDNEVYYFKNGAATWELGYTYPVGTEINVLYYDELLVGTGTGLFAHFNSGTAVSAEEDREMPNRLVLHQNYPNPFNPNTQIAFDLPASTHVTLSVYNILGQKVSEVFNGRLSAGQHSFSFDASGLSSGMYIYRIQTPESTISKRMLLIK